MPSDETLAVVCLVWVPPGHAHPPRAYLLVNVDDVELVLLLVSQQQLGALVIKHAGYAECTQMVDQRPNVELVERANGS